MNFCAEVKLNIYNHPTSWVLTIRVFDKELFHMEDIDDEDEDYDEDESQEKLISNDPAKQLYKQF